MSDHLLKRPPRFDILGDRLQEVRLYIIQPINECLVHASSVILCYGFITTGAVLSDKKFFVCFVFVVFVSLLHLTPLYLKLFSNIIHFSSLPSFFLKKIALNR